MLVWWIIGMHLRLRRCAHGVREYFHFLVEEFRNMDRNVSEWDLITAVPARSLTPRTTSRHMERRGQK